MGNNGTCPFCGQGINFLSKTSINSFECEDCGIITIAHTGSLDEISETFVPKESDRRKIAFILNKRKLEGESGYEFDKRNEFQKLIDDNEAKLPTTFSQRETLFVRFLYRNLEKHSPIGYMLSYENSAKFGLWEKAKMRAFLKHLEDSPRLKSLQAVIDKGRFILSRRGIDEVERSIADIRKNAE